MSEHESERPVEQSEQGSDRPAGKVRRRDRRFDEPEWMDRLLQMGSIAHLAFVWQGRPMIHAQNYWLDGGVIYWHGAQAGLLREAVSAGPLDAALSVGEHGRLLIADTADEFSTEYASVVVHGTVRIVEDDAERQRVLAAIVAKYPPQLLEGRDYQAADAASVKRTTVYRMEIESRTGKHNIKPASWPSLPYPDESFIELERAAGRFTLLPKDLA